MDPALPREPERVAEPQGPSGWELGVRRQILSKTHRWKWMSTTHLRQARHNARCQPLKLVIDEADESSGTQRPPLTSMHHGEADAQVEVLCARLGHPNLKSSRMVPPRLQQAGTPYRQMTSSKLQAMPQCPACTPKGPQLQSTRIFEQIILIDSGKDGSKYIITFTDDYSRGSWPYPWPEN